MDLIFHYFSLSLSNFFDNLSSGRDMLLFILHILILLYLPRRLEENDNLVLTPFEKNLDIWRQLWRVLERSDLVGSYCRWIIQSRIIIIQNYIHLLFIILVILLLQCCFSFLTIWGKKRESSYDLLVLHFFKSLSEKTIEGLLFLASGHNK